MTCFFLQVLNKASIQTIRGNDTPGHLRALEAFRWCLHRRHGMLPEDGFTGGGGGRSLLLGPLPSSKRPLQALEKMVQGLEEARFCRSPGVGVRGFLQASRRLYHGLSQALLPLSSHSSPFARVLAFGLSISFFLVPFTRVVPISPLLESFACFLVDF